MHMNGNLQAIAYKYSAETAGYAACSDDSIITHEHQSRLRCQRGR